MITREYKWDSLSQFHTTSWGWPWDFCCCPAPAPPSGPSSVTWTSSATQLVGPDLLLLAMKDTGSPEIFWVYIFFPFLMTNLGQIYFQYLVPPGWLQTGKHFSSQTKLIAGDWLLKSTKLLRRIHPVSCRLFPFLSRPGNNPISHPN